jgi:hypothetical protein
MRRLQETAFLVLQARRGYAVMRDISTLIENLKDITWKWSEVAIESVLVSIGGEFVEAVTGRWIRDAWRANSKRL